MGGRQVSRKSTREEFHVVTHTLLGLLQIVRCRQIDEKLTPGCRKILNLCLSHVAFLSQSVYAFQNVLQILLISSKFAYKFWGSKCDYFLWSSAEIANCFWSTSQELLRGVSMLPIHSAKKKKNTVSPFEKINLPGGFGAITRLLINLLQDSFPQQIICVDTGIINIPVGTVALQEVTFRQHHMRYGTSPLSWNFLVRTRLLRNIYILSRLF